MDDSQALAQRLIRAVRRLGVPHTFEPSFKLMPGELARKRFLIGVHKKRLGARPAIALIDILQSVDMPGEQLAAYCAALPQSEYVLFGFEEQGGKCIYKAYLEFYEAALRQMQADPSSDARAYRLFTGFKWQAGPGKPIAKGKPVATEYLWYPALSHAQIAERSNATVTNFPVLTSAVRRIFGRLDDTAPECSLYFLEAQEAGNERRSFDINLYAAGMRVADVGEELHAVASAFCIAEAELATHLSQVGASAFGHLSAGSARNGEGFLCVYHGVRKVPGSVASAASPARP